MCWNVRAFSVLTGYNERGPSLLVSKFRQKYWRTAAVCGISPHMVLSFAENQSSLGVSQVTSGYLRDLPSGTCDNGMGNRGPQGLPPPKSCTTISSKLLGASCWFRRRPIDVPPLNLSVDLGRRAWTVVERWLEACIPRSNHAESAVLKELKIRIHDGGRAQYAFSTLRPALASTVKKSPLATSKVSTYRR